MKWRAISLLGLSAACTQLDVNQLFPTLGTGEKPSSIKQVHWYLFSLEAVYLTCVAVAGLYCGVFLQKTCISRVNRPVGRTGQQYLVQVQHHALDGPAWKLACTLNWKQRENIQKYKGKRKKKKADITVLIYWGSMRKLHVNRVKTGFPFSLILLDHPTDVLPDPVVV